jgi:GH25 family lysozyme M1 (1,4-beta-N-acetylmuramidase)
MILKQNTGVDLSDYQPGLQIGTLNPLPRFVVMKATESTGFRCVTTIDFAAQCKALGIPFGFYHFWQNTNPIQQVSNYIQQVNLAGGFERFPPVLDLEVSLIGQSANIKTWLDLVEDIAGTRPILYSNKSHFDMIAGNAWFKTYDAWTAAYPANPDLWAWCPSLYSEKRARREIIWQYASTYRYPNYTKNSVDTNIAITDFLNEIGAIIPPIGEPTMYKYTATAQADGTRLRPAPNVNQTYLASYPAGTQFFGDVKYIAAPPLALNSVAGDVWIEVQEIQPPTGARIIKAGWVAVIHQGKAVCSLVENVVTPPTFAHALDVTLDGVVVYHKDFN